MKNCNILVNIMLFHALLINALLAQQNITPTQQAQESSDTNEDLNEKAAQIVDLFYALNGDVNKPHKKINHEKGFCAKAEFIPNKKVANSFDIPLLKASKIEVSVRFSLGGGEQSDKSKGRAMALKMHAKNQTTNENQLANKEDFWEIAMTNSRINFATNADEFIEFMQINLGQKQGRLTPQEASIRRAKVPSFVNFAKEIESLGISPSFANNAYHSVHTFFFTKSSGETIPARFSFVPKEGIKYLKPSELDILGDDFLESNFKKQLKSKNIAFNLTLEVAKSSDSISDTATVWTKDKRERITLGTLKINEFSGYECNGEVFMPQVLPQGVLPPRDNIFDVRNMVYALTFGKRQ